MVLFDLIHHPIDKFGRIKGNAAIEKEYVP